MPDPGPEPMRLSGEFLAVHAREMHAARSRLRAARGVAHARELQLLRGELLVAMERYAVAITSRGVPVPQRVRAEIELYRRLRQRS